MLAFLFLNGFTSFACSFCFWYIFMKDNSQDKTILQEQVCHLSKKIRHLESTIDEMEEKFIRKENALLQSNSELNTKLQEFIDFNYEVLE